MENTCRVCANATINLMDIFSKLNQEEPCPADMLVDFVDPELQNNDAFPRKICLKCVVSVQNAFKLKQKYKQSQEHFKLFSNADNSNNLKQLSPKSNVEIQKEIKAEPIDNETISLASTEYIENCAPGEETMEALKIEESQVEDYNTSLNNFNSNEIIYMESATAGDQDPNTYVIDSTYFGINQGIGQLTHWCDTCGKGFSNQLELFQHSLDHVNLDKHQCPYCNQVFQSRPALYHHVIIHSGKRSNKCPHCSKYFVYERNLKKHIKDHLVPPRIQCPKCKLRFAKRHQLRMHMRRHVTCQFCEKKFSSSSLMKKHLRTHSAERPFQCPQCPSRFILQATLQSHINTHLKKRKQFKCINCPKSFSYAETLNRHLRFDCKFCTITGNRTARSSRSGKNRVAK